MPAYDIRLLGTTQQLLSLRSCSGLILGEIGAEMEKRPEKARDNFMPGDSTRAIATLRQGLQDGEFLGEKPVKRQS